MEKCVRCNASIETLESSNLCEKCFKHLNAMMALIDGSLSELNKDTLEIHENNGVEISENLDDEYILTSADNLIGEAEDKSEIIVSPLKNEAPASTHTTETERDTLEILDHVQGKTSDSDQTQQCDPIAESSYPEKNEEVAKIMKCSQEEDKGQELDTTVSPGEIFTKQRAVEEDMSDNLFIETLYIPPNKRAGNYKHFKEEVIVSGIYQINKTGFSTNRPLAWAKALENLFKEEQIAYTWTYQKKLSQFYKSEIILTHEGKKLLIQIFINSGMITLQGHTYKEWVDSYFEKLKGTLGTETIPPANDDKVANQASKEAVAVGQKSTITIKDKISKEECDLIWEKLDEIQRALITQDHVIQQIIERCQAIELKVNDLNADQIIAKFDSSADMKITAFLDTIYEDIKNKTSEVKQFASSKVGSMNKRIDKLYTKIDRKPETQIEDSSTVSPCPEEDFKKVKAQVDRIDCETQDLIKNSNTGDHEFKNIKKQIEQLEREIRNVNNTLKSYSSSSAAPSFPIAPASVRPRYPPPTSLENNHQPRDKKVEKKVELLLCFDSNGRYIEPQKLWKVRGSEYKRCSCLHDVSQVVRTFDAIEIEHIFISVGTNDLDDKDHDQVFGEAELLIDEIRSNHANIKIIFSEVPPRKDDRDDECTSFNELLREYAENHDDITVVVHQNLRDDRWSMYRDAKHIHPKKIARYAANIIMALKKAYGIEGKSELFIQSTKSPARKYDHSPNRGLSSKLQSLAGYDNSDDYRRPLKASKSDVKAKFKEFQDMFISILDT